MGGEQPSAQMDLVGPRLPNMRVQRTRVSLPAVARRSPLTRRPLGRRELSDKAKSTGLRFGVGTSFGSQVAEA
jgi:hypothetical protein